MIVQEVSLNLNFLQESVKGLKTTFTLVEQFL